MHGDRRWCLPGAITVTATNFCPPNYTLPKGDGWWCNLPLQHFDLALLAFLRILYYRVGIVTVPFRSVAYASKGRVRFTGNGHAYFNLVHAVAVKGSHSHTRWQSMSHNWGKNWQINGYLNGQVLSFHVTASDGRALVSANVTPPVGSSIRPSKVTNSDHREN